ncbi:glycerol-3-phosphate 1-O-acyltransferase PlsY [Novosphingopyxis iocasae]|uniref:glycerol-3-phosphate 1-O-acyltransferase PlsY n=1 Tax=Novosphingopyxis iocasae TaxID=2762729 RepID=UPI0016519F41|nr:glycerol-3-phosphate 1-O-acyltransferase PlsY [Novosphingopyxis iocasae]
MSIYWAVLLGYLLGSIPFGILLTRMFGAGDLRSIGSGNIGATNVLRTGRKGLAAATLLLDLLKGLAAVLIARAIYAEGADYAAQAAAAGAFIGHLYPVWLRFNGGKGIATLGGIMFGLFWEGGLIYAVIWLGSLALLRISSLAGLLAAASAPIAALIFGHAELVPLLIAFLVLTIWKHKENVARLLKGQEPKVGQR